MTSSIWIGDQYLHKQQNHNTLRTKQGITHIMIPMPGWRRAKIPENVKQLVGAEYGPDTNQ
jgi:hypothetical protein